MNSALAEVNGVDERGDRGVILVGLGDEVDFTSPPARRLLREFFPATSGGHLPNALAEWLESDAGQPLIRRRGRRRLTVKRADHSLLLEERQRTDLVDCTRTRGAGLGCPGQDQRRDRAAALTCAEHGAKAPGERVHQARGRHTHRRSDPVSRSRRRRRVLSGRPARSRAAVRRSSSSSCLSVRARERVARCHVVVCISFCPASASGGAEVQRRSVPRE